MNIYPLADLIVREGLYDVRRTCSSHVISVGWLQSACRVTLTKTRRMSLLGDCLIPPTLEPVGKGQGFPARDNPCTSPGATAQQMTPLYPGSSKIGACGATMQASAVRRSQASPILGIVFVPPSR